MQEGNKKHKGLILLISAICVFAVILILGHYGLQHTQADDWQRVVSREGGFSILMPGKPVEKILTPMTSQGALKIRTFYLEKKINRFYRQIFMVVFQDAMVQPLPGRTLPQRLDDAVKGLFLYQPGEIISQKEIEVAGSPGREVLYRQSVPDHQDMQCLARVFEIRNRYYQLVFGEHADYPFIKQPDMNQAEKFFESFRILPQAD